MSEADAHDEAPPQSLARPRSAAGVLRADLEPQLRVCVIFTSGDPRDDPKVEIECVACAELVEWQVEQDIWVCRGCQRPLIPPQVIMLLSRSRRRLGKALNRARLVDSDVRGGIGRWLGRLRFHLSRFLGRQS